MKEILYRAWLKDEKKILKVYSIYIELRRVCCEYDDDVKVFDFDEIELMQYTGLCDKNGTKIFEGDIVKSNNGFFYKVFFADGSFRLNGKMVNTILRQGIVYSFCLGVVGNIYENSELLGESI